jgi:hypothetical protein
MLELLHEGYIFYRTTSCFVMDVIEVDIVAMGQETVQYWWEVWEQQ